MSKNTPITSRSLSKDLYISRVIEKSWFMRESRGRKPDWLDDNKSFSIKNLYSSLNKSLSNILLKIGSKRQVGSFLCIVYPFFFFWRIGTTFTFFHSIVNFIWLSHDLKIIERGLHKKGPHNYNIRILSTSWPWALSGSRLFIILIMFWPITFFSKKS